MRLRSKLSKSELQQRIEELEKSNLNLKELVAEKEDLIKEKNELNKFSLLNAILENESLFYYIYCKNDNSLIFSSEPSMFFEIDFTNKLEDFIDIIHNEDKDNVKRIFEDSNSEQTILFRTQVVSKENKVQRNYRLTISKHPLIELGNDQYLVTIQNITKEIKQKKEILKGKEKAEESDKLKNIFLSKISQYIRTPMNSIVGFSELLTIYDPGEEQRKEFLDVIRRQSKTLLDIVNDISEIARYSTGDIEIKKTTIDLNLVLKELVLGFEQIRPEKRKEDVKLTTEFPQLKGFKLFSDSGRIQQITSNLISHLLSLTEKGNIVISYNLPSENKFDIILKVDSLAIPKEKQKDYFNQYTYSESDATSKYNESGIGLAISKIVAKAMNGKIQLNSDNDIGTQFIITLPFEHPQQEIESNAFEETIDGGRYDFKDKVVLIVDDEEVNIMFIEAVISGTNAKTIIAKNGYEAIELCKNLPKIDLILMDILMPGMNGIKTTSEIRKFNPYVPIIAQTALSQSEDHENCINAGCNTTITKPIEVEKLLMLLDMYFVDK